MTTPLKSCCCLPALVLAFLLPLTHVGHAAPGQKTEAASGYTLAQLVQKIDQLEKKQIVLEGTVIGTCKSGCKMWVADGNYKEGDLYALVRAKDNAFKFDTKSTGKPVRLKGYAVAKLLDYCADGSEKDGEGDCATPVKDGGKDEPKIQVTFFATEVAQGAP
ncbi:hypothetical protein [Haloferula sp. A504]|uniref:hypothetical protein n=1 Tax=Haloferula sp. A504 TaxID=3373601 RepID=UPI0031BDC51A|nr:hypothetical protein [Verrucomicrobiaceae bacterium E54]